MHVCDGTFEVSLAVGCLLFRWYGSASISCVSIAFGCGCYTPTRPGLAFALVFPFLQRSAKSEVAPTTAAPPKMIVGCCSNISPRIVHSGFKVVSRWFQGGFMGLGPICDQVVRFGFFGCVGEGGQRGPRGEECRASEGIGRPSGALLHSTEFTSVATAAAPSPCSRRAANTFRTSESTLVAAFLLSWLSPATLTQSPPGKQNLATLAQIDPRP